MTVQPQPTNAPRLHYAWVVAVVTFFVLLLAAGARTMAAVFIVPLEGEFGWTRSAISAAISIGILWFGLGGPVGGALIDRFGPRRIMVCGLALVTAGLVLMLRLEQLWQLHLFWGVLVGIGTGAVANVMGATIASRWFRQHRGVIIGLFGAASAAGQLIFQPTMMSLTATTGWRSGITLAAIALAVMIIPTLLFMRDRPEEKGLRPYGDDGTPATAAAASDQQRTPLRAAAQTRDFWLLAFSFFICGWTTNGLVQTHLLPHAIEHGFDPVRTSQVVGLMGLFNIVGTLASGWLSDRVDNRYLLACYYGLRGLSIAMLPLIGSMLGLSAFAVIYGLDWIATVPPTINLTAQRFGRASVGTLYGWIFFSHMVGAAVAAYTGGLLHDLLGDYTVAFVIAGVMGLLAVAFSLGISSPRRMQAAQAAA